MLEEQRKELTEDAKLYAHVDYDDDIKILNYMIDAALETMGELIDDFDEDNMSARQRLSILLAVKDLYDNREKYSNEKNITNAAATLLLGEIYRGDGK